MPRRNAAQALTAAQRITGANLDAEQIATLSIDEIRSKIVAIGADYHPAETKLSLAARLLQLQGIAQPTDALQQRLKESGLEDDADEENFNPKRPKVTKRMTAAQMKKVAAPYIAKGLRIKLSKDGLQWHMAFEFMAKRSDGKVVPATKVDSGNTMMPLETFRRACEIICIVPVIKKQTAEETFANIDGDEIGDEISRDETLLA